MKRALVCVFAFGLVALLPSLLSQAIAADEVPADRVVVMYFHRTQRCPTCLKMGSYSEEAVKKGFDKEIKAGTVNSTTSTFRTKRTRPLRKATRSPVPR